MEPTTVTMSSSEEEDATCPSIPKSTRYILFIIQGIIGIILTIPPLIPGISNNDTIDILDYFYLPFQEIFFFFLTSLIISKTAIYGIIIVLTASLWIMKPLTLWKKLIHPVRLTTFIILIVSIVLCLLGFLTTIFQYVSCGFTFWLLLSFIPGAQEWLKNCCSGCCNLFFKGKETENQNLV